MEMGFDLAELLYGLTLVEPQADRGASPETNAHEQHPPAPSSDPQPTESEPEDQIMISRNNRRPMRFREICGAGRSVQQRRVESPAEPAQPVRTTSRPASKSAQPSARPKPHLKPPR
ncbi:uncharacterized protein BYT42DRAFT_566710 [Radiomyces spectabilis]|uniref:uncharacterized protein n=1 Tax=Radiomyces spectabilis TaxID=64574 RepID=UPI002220C4A8|nr:uncharacterized protein BYT42DRAFT_566710 [Radiomyces spectabilis]KAI8381489.1 hypothetical protein BYT42DRAFT_566710 [Radiomyces spectabilis]